MEFEWDERKGRSNIEKHQLDFLDAAYVFERPLLRQQARTEEGELRWMAIGMLDDVCVAIIYTLRGAAIRLISMRKADRDERRGYFQIFSAAVMKRKASRESRTDLARLRNMTEAELRASIASDPDWRDVPADWHRKAEAVMPTRKRLVSVRLDADVLDWFRDQGTGYQTRINAVLRSFMDHEKSRRAG